MQEIDYEIQLIATSIKM